ncbi:RxLR effector protein [Phytophthora megakarya]|uniref:RxLR effector protein n=1 Tax=Phytophthora megakarya TaxID=4795 RepID=A0A225V2Y1_9STRA|nr:RxLR effector protein [Phytophthora megakarya]
MRLLYSLMVAVSILAARQAPIAASAGSDVALTGVTSLVFFILVGANQSVRYQPRFLRANNIDKGDKEERLLGFAEIVEKLMAKNIVDKMMRTQSFSALEKVDDLSQLNRISDAVDDHMMKVFKFADNANMKPRDMANQLRNMPEADDAIATKTLELYTNYLKKHGKLDKP